MLIPIQNSIEHTKRQKQRTDLNDRCPGLGCNLIADLSSTSMHATVILPPHNTNIEAASQHALFRFQNNKV